ncbi:MAG: hypothetical protein COT71_01085, partial [Candidatus Andersenbacteria bacterium CG10_big_fil_rev_8_21_14_0_10_54_11]
MCGILNANMLRQISFTQELGRLVAVRPRRELRELYMFTVLFSFASSLIAIFEPVFFFQQGFSLSLIALYYALHYTLYTIIMPFGGKFAAWFGTERALGVSMPLFVVYFLLLALLPQARGLFWVAWVLLALFKIFYWPAYHAEVAKFGDGQNRGTEISWLFAVSYGTGVLGPLIGGVVATYFGFPVLFIIAAGLAVVAAFPLLRTSEDNRRMSFPYTSSWRILFSRRHRRMRWASLGWGENLIDLVYWPIFLFIVLGGADTLGYVASLNTLLMAALGFFIGEMSERLPRRAVLRLHLPFFVLSYLFRPLAATVPAAMLTDSLAKASSIGVRIPQWFRLYAQGQRHGALRYVIAVELALAVVKAVTAWV